MNSWESHKFEVRLTDKQKSQSTWCQGRPAVMNWVLWTRIFREEKSCSHVLIFLSLSPTIISGRKGNATSSVTSSGIVATLINGGILVHSMLNLPLNLSIKTSQMCNICQESVMATVLQGTCLAVWDEYTLTSWSTKGTLPHPPRYEKKTMARSWEEEQFFLQEIFVKCCQLFPKGSKADDVKACDNTSYLWKHVKKNSYYKQRLTAFAKWSHNLLETGKGILTFNWKTSATNITLHAGKWYFILRIKNFLIYLSITLM